MASLWVFVIDSIMGSEHLRALGHVLGGGKSQLLPLVPSVYRLTGNTHCLYVLIFTSDLATSTYRH